jgi:protein TonB
MFDNLVVSTGQRRRGRTAKFVVCTSVIYLCAVVVAFAVSVLLETPKLADTTVPMPMSTVFRIKGPVKTDTDNGHSTTAPTRDPNHVQPLDQILSNIGTSPAVNTRSLPPGVADVGGLDVPPGDGGPGVPGLPGPIGRETSPGAAPGEPPEPPRPMLRQNEADNKPLRISSTVLQGKTMERRVPVYPDLARRIRLQGEVAVEVIISPEGRVESVRAVSGHPMFTQSALDAARSWRFSPTLLNGVPVRVTGVITFVFKLTE